MDSYTVVFSAVAHSDSSADVPVRRMLPQTPGKVVTSAPPAKPKRHQHNVSSGSVAKVLRNEHFSSPLQSPRPALLERSNTPSTVSSLSVSNCSVDLEGSQLDSGECVGRGGGEGRGRRQREGEGREVGERGKVEHVSVLNLRLSVQVYGVDCRELLRRLLPEGSATTNENLHQ